MLSRFSSDVAILPRLEFPSALFGPRGGAAHCQGVLAPTWTAPWASVKSGMADSQPGTFQISGRLCWGSLTFCRFDEGDGHEI